MRSKARQDISIEQVSVFVRYARKCHAFDGIEFVEQDDGPRNTCGDAYLPYECPTPMNLSNECPCSLPFKYPSS